jgi:hypothetical protein
LAIQPNHIGRLSQRPVLQKSFTAQREGLNQ